MNECLHYKFNSMYMYNVIHYNILTSFQKGKNVRGSHVDETNIERTFTRRQISRRLLTILRERERERKAERGSMHACMKGPILYNSILGI